MQINYETTSQHAYTDLMNAKSTFALDVLSHALHVVKESGHIDILTADDLEEGYFWMEHSQHNYEENKFFQTIDALVELELLHLTKFGTDLNGHSIYKNDVVSSL